MIVILGGTMVLTNLALMISPRLREGIDEAIPEANPKATQEAGDDTGWWNIFALSENGVRFNCGDNPPCSNGYCDIKTNTCVETRRPEFDLFAGFL